MAGPRLNVGARKLFDRIGIRPMAPGESSAERYTGQKYSQGLYGYQNTDPVPPMAAASPLSGYGMGTPGMFRGAAPVQIRTPFLPPSDGQVGSPLMGGRLAQGGMPGGMSIMPKRGEKTMEFDFRDYNPSSQTPAESPLGSPNFVGDRGYQVGQLQSPDPRETMLQSSIDRIGSIRANAQAALANAQQFGSNRQQNFDTRWSQYGPQAAEMNQYGTNPSITPGQQYANRIASQVGYTQNGVDVGLAAQNNTNRQFALTNSSMAQQFGPNSPLTAQGNANAEMMQRERNGEGVMMQTGGYGSPLTFVPRNPNAGSGEPLRSKADQARRAGDTALADRLDAETKAKGDAMRARQAERRAARGGLTERQGRELGRDQRRQSQDLFQRGISPNSPLGKSIAPDLQPRPTQGPQAFTSPLTKADGSVVNPVPQGAPKSAANAQSATGAAHAIVQQAPIFKAIGLDPGETPDEMPGVGEVVSSLSGYLDSGKPVGVEDIDAVHQLAVQLDQANRLNDDGFLSGMFTGYRDKVRKDMFRQLARIPAGNRNQLQQWWQHFQSVPSIEPGGQSTGSQGPYIPPTGY